jgi:hypothetical protein
VYVLSFFSVKSVEPPSKKSTSSMGAHWSHLFHPCPLVPSAQQSSVVLKTGLFGLEI